MSEHNKIPILGVMDQAPDNLKPDIALHEGILYCSDSREGDPHFISFLSLAKRMGITEHKFVPAESFEKQYGGSNLGASSSLMSDTQVYATHLINEAFKEGATDIHLAHYGSYGNIRFRRLGLLRDYAKLPGEYIETLIGTIYNTLAKSANTPTFAPTARQDARIIERKWLPKDVHSVRLHTEPLECAQADNGTGTLMVLRLLHDRTEAKGNLDERLRALGYGEKDILKFHQLTQRTGMTIISGPTGHGKSTLLKHLMDGMILRDPQKHYLSIEDPPEYPIGGVHQVKLLTNLDAKADPAQRAREYINAINGSLRSDIDTLMVGEVRYGEAAAAVIEAALSGHGTFTTLHANDAIGVISRMKSLLSSAGFADPLEYLCDPSALAGLVCQRLLPVLCPHCKIPLSSLKTTEDKEYRLEVLPDDTLANVMNVVKDIGSVHIRGRGCEHCNKLGIVRQTVAAEVIVTDETFLRHIREGHTGQAKAYWLGSMQGRTFVQHAVENVEKGLIDPYLAELRLGVSLNSDSGAGK